MARFSIQNCLTCPRVFGSCSPLCRLVAKCPPSLAYRRPSHPSSAHDISLIRTQKFKRRGILLLRECIRLIEQLISIIGEFLKLQVVTLMLAQNPYSPWVFKHLNAYENFQQRPLSGEMPYEELKYSRHLQKSHVFSP